MKLFTIGFTKKTAEQFFARLRQPGLMRVADIRLNNVSQLAGFTKRDDLRYFLKAINGIDYVHLSDLAPDQPMLDAYKKNGGDWATYERDFLMLMRKRKVENKVPPELLDGACLLCSEATPEHCHRRLVAEYLQSHWTGVDIRHL